MKWPILTFARLSDRAHQSIKIILRLSKTFKRLCFWKVIFGNQFQELCNYFEEDWGLIKDIITGPQQQRIVDSHLDEIPNTFGFGGHCLPKDTLAILTKLENVGLDYKLLRAVLDDNARLINEHQ